MNEALRSGNLDVSTTQVGGKAVDLGGFKQYVHKSDPVNNRVEFGVEMDVSNLGKVWQELFQGSKILKLSFIFGPRYEEVKEEVEREMTQPDGKIVRLKAPLPTGRFVQSEDTALNSFHVFADEQRLMTIQGSPKMGYNIDLDQKSAFMKELVKSIALSSTTAKEFTDDELVHYEADITSIIYQFIVKIGTLMPTKVITGEDVTASALGISPAFMEERRIKLVSKARRKEDIIEGIKLVLPRRITQLLNSLDAALSNVIESLVYLGPLRSFPPRHIAFSETNDENWFAGGGYAWDLVRKNKDVRAEVNKWLSSSDHLQTPYELIVRDLLPLDENAVNILFDGLEEINKTGIDYLGEGDAEGLVEVDKGIKDPDTEADKLLDRLSTFSTGKLQELVMIDKHYDRPVVVTHRDVGIGVSQVLPVLVYAYANKGKLIAIEQPEIHIHPKLQAELADVFIESALGERKNTFLLETHSEHLILRVMRRMRETFEERLPEGVPPIRPQDVSILFVEPDAKGSIVREMELNARGELVKAWPGGFFEEGLKEVFA
jgi:hypothetical protein